MYREIATLRIDAIFGELLNGISDLNEGRSSRNLIETLERLRCLAHMRIRTSPSEERERACNLTSALVNGREAQAEAESLKHCLEARRNNHLSLVEDMKKQITDERMDMEKIKLYYQQQATETLKNSRSSVETIVKETLTEEEKIKAEIAENSKKYQMLCEEHLRCEKKLYFKREQVEHKYLAIVAKYDKDVGALHHTMKALMNEVNLLEVNLCNLQEKLAIQQVTYEQLKTERENEILRIFTENLNNFKKNRAAKIIQRAWRWYLQRLLLRKKKKSKKRKQ